MKAQLAGSRALITGASGSLGAAAARWLAAAGANLVLSGRQEAPLQALAETLHRERGVEVQIVLADLASPAGAEALFQAATADARQLDVLINNAGFGAYGRLAELPLARQLEMVAVNVRAVTELAWRFIDRVRPTGRSAYLLNVASLAGFVPIPKLAVYAATKAYVRSLSEALALELVSTPIRVACLCPGPIDTPFWDAAGKQVGPLGRLSMVSADVAMARALRTLTTRGPTVIVPGVPNAAIAASSGWLPRKLSGLGAFVWLGGLHDRD